MPAYEKYWCAFDNGVCVSILFVDDKWAKGERVKWARKGYEVRHLPYLEAKEHLDIMWSNK